MATGFLVAMTALSAATSIKQGIDERNAAKRQAGLMEEETRIAAMNKTNDLKRLEGAQRLAYAKSGVTLEGSPLLVLNETHNQGTREIDNLLTSGYTKAEYTRLAGRDAFVAGVLNAGTTAMKGGAKIAAAS